MMWCGQNHVVVGGVGGGGLISRINSINSRSKNNMGETWRQTLVMKALEEYGGHKSWGGGLHIYIYKDKQPNDTGKAMRTEMILLTIVIIIIE